MRYTLRIVGVMLFVVLFINVGCNQSTPPPEDNQAKEAAVSVTDEPANVVEEAAADSNSAPAPEEEAAAKQVENKPGQMEPLLKNLRHSEGDPNAPVTIIEYSDFKCPYCAQFATDTLYWIRRHYVETGQVRFAFKHIATLGPESRRAAEASECAAEQDQFWAYHDQIYANQAARGSLLSDETLIGFAETLELDTTAFEECLISGRHLEHVKEQTLEAEAIGVRATPGFVINGILYIGSHPFDVFVELIEQDLEDLGVQAGASQPADDIEGLIVFPADPPPLEVLDGVFQNCGIYSQPVSIDNVLSSLAHGAVWIAYRNDLPPEQIETLQTIVRQAQHDEPMIILSPGPYTNTPVMVSAWRVQLALTNAGDPRLQQFLDQFQAGPFTPEPGQPCSGGVGEPVG